MSLQSSEFASFKSLLKNLYSAHVSRVKELESEVKTLKDQLTLKAREAKDIQDCKRCAELESAFKSCKKALEEQSKFFETFGQKFSIFNDSEKGSSEMKASQSLSKYDRVTTNSTSSIKDGSPLVPDPSNVFNLASKGRQDILKKVRHDDENLNTFDLFSIESLTLKVDDTYSKKFNDSIFAPNTEELHSSSKKGVKRSSTDCFSEDEEAKNPDYKEPETSKKKTLKNEEKKASEHVKTISNQRSVDKNQSNPNNLCGTSSRLSTKSTVNAAALNPEVTPNVEASEYKEIQNDTPKTNLLVRLNDKISQITSPSETSPSLLPKTSTAPKKLDLKTVETDNNDFIEVTCVGSKSNQSGDNPTSGAKQKATKKLRPAIKCTSKYKMTLDAPPLNYKKPNFKQSKLSKSFFQGKKNPVDSEELSQGPNSKDEKEPVPTITLEEFQTSTPKEFLPAVDIDATFIPENYGRKSSPFTTTTNVEKNAAEVSNLRNGSLFSNISFLEAPKPKVMNPEIINSSSEDELECKENMNSYDRLPVPEEPKFKYKNDVVRKKAERKQLNGFDCKECEKYYSELGLSEKEKKERLKKCSRHRGKYAPPPTPDHFWELDFPDTEECKIRGYMDDTQKVKLNQLAS